MKIFGFKDNKCAALGLQGVCTEYTYNNTSGSSVIFAFDEPENNSRYVFKEYGSGVIGECPTIPDPYFNFNITIQSSDGFSGSLSTFIKLAYTSTTSTDTPEYVTVYYDNPDFDITDGYTVLHLKFWFDGINYCCHVDGYSTT